MNICMNILHVAALLFFFMLLQCLILIPAVLHEFCSMLSPTLYSIYVNHFISQLPVTLPEFSTFISFCFLTHTQILLFHHSHCPLCHLHYRGVQLLNIDLYFWKSLPKDIRDLDCLSTLKFCPKILTLEIKFLTLMTF